MIVRIIGSSSLKIKSFSKNVYFKNCFVFYYFFFFFFLNKQNQAIFRKNDLLYFFSKENINDFQRGLQDIQKKAFILFLFLNLVKALIILIEMGLYMLLFFFSRLRYYA